MLRDAQTHALPESDIDRARIARGLGYADWDALRTELDGHRARVATEFEALLAPRGRAATPSDLATYWRALPDAGDAQALADAGFQGHRDARRQPAGLRPRTGRAHLVGRHARAPGSRPAGAARLRRAFVATRCRPAPRAAAAAHVAAPRELPRTAGRTTRRARAPGRRRLRQRAPCRTHRRASAVARRAAGPPRCRCPSGTHAACRRLHGDLARGRRRSGVDGAQRSPPGAELPRRAGDARRAAIRTGQRATAGVAGRWRGRRGAGAGRARSRACAWPHPGRAFSRCSGTAASVARSSGSVRTSIWCSSTTRRRTHSPTVPAHSTPRAGSRDWRRKSWRCSAR
jgi:hypothetical protein